MTVNVNNTIKEIELPCYTDVQHKAYCVLHIVYALCNKIIIANIMLITYIIKYNSNNNSLPVVSQHNYILCMS